MGIAVDIVLQFHINILIISEYYMVFQIVLSIAILLDFQNYPNTEKAASPSQGISPFPVASTTHWAAVANAASVANYPPSSTEASFQRSWASSQTEGSNGGSQQDPLEVRVVQASQQESGDTVRFMSHRMGTLCGHLLCARGQIRQKSQKKKAVGRPTVEHSFISEQTNKKSHAIASTQKENTEGQERQGTELWCASIGTTMARFGDCASTAAAHLSRIGQCGAVPDGARGSLRDVGSAYHCGRAEGHRQDEAAAGNGQVCHSGLPEAGEEAQAAFECATGKAQSTPIVECLLGGVYQAMEEVCRRFRQEGPGIGEASVGSQRCDAGGKRQTRRSQGSTGQAGCSFLEGSRRGTRGDLRREHGRSRTRAVGDGSRDPRRNQYYASDVRDRTGASHRDRRGAQLQKSSCGWKRALLWICSHEAFWQARQIDPYEEVCQGRHLEQHPLILQWTHSILEEENFMNELKASITALDLQYEVDPMCGTQGDRPISCKASNACDKLNRHPSFAQTAELYVGLEHELIYQKWPCRTGQAVLSSPIFQSHHLISTDEVSWMAAPVGREDRLQPALHGDQDRLIDNDDIAIHPHDQIAPEHDDEVQTFPEEDSSMSSEAEDAAQVSDWHTTVLFALDFIEVPLRLDWNDYEGFHAKVARRLGISSDNLYDTHHVRHQPEDLSRANTEAIIAHRHGDLAPGSALRFTLIDVEFHHASPTFQPEIVRKVYKLPPHIGRVTLLHSLGLGHYCREVGHQCIVWHNHDMLSLRSAALIELHDGDFLRIAVPPTAEEPCTLSTRNVATALHQGISVEDLRQQHALFQLGWRDTVLSLPMVPIVPDFEIHDEQVLLQTSLVPALEVGPAFLDLSVEEFMMQCKSNQFCEPPMLELSSGAVPPQQDRERLVEQQHETIRQLHRHWRLQGAARNANEENVMVIYTWFLSYPQVMKCERHREIHLRQDFWNWHTQIEQRWRDLLEENMPYDLYIVQPTPIGRTFTEDGPKHVILLQRAAVEHSATVLTILNNLPSTGSTLEQVAIFAPAEASRRELIRHFNLHEICGEHQMDVQCLFWHGDFEYGDDQRRPLRHGFSILLILNNRRPTVDNLWNVAEEEEELTLMQGSTLNPNAPAFQPHNYPTSCLSEDFRDIYDAWNSRAASWEGEARSISFDTWMVDHRRQQLHCERPRRVRLYDQIEKWDEAIKRAWADQLHEGEPYEIHLVQPNPPDMDQNITS